MSYNPATSGIAGAADVFLNNPTSGDALSYNTSTAKWQNAALDKTRVGLGNVDNTSDTNKPISTAQQTALDNKLDTTFSIPIIFATSATTIPSRASGIPSGYAGRVAFDTADYPSHTGPTDMQVGDRWRRRVT